MKPQTLRVALLQETERGSVAANLDAIEAGLREAAAVGVQLVLLQELHNGPYFCQHESVDEFDRAEPIPGPSTERIGALAEELQLVVVASLFERRAAGLYHNTAVVFDRSRAIAGRYRKMHIPDDPAFYEKFYFTPGDLGFDPIDTSVGKLGVLVCWDQWYPEAARLMALAGAELLLYPTAIGWDPQDDDAEKQRQRDAWVTVQRGHAVAKRPRGRQRPATARLQPHRLRSGAGRRPRHPVLGHEFRRRAAGRIPRPGEHRAARTADRRHRSQAQRERAPHLAVPARPPHRRLRRSAAPLPRLTAARFSERVPGASRQRDAPEYPPSPPNAAKQALAALDSEGDRHAKGLLHRVQRVQ
jgi:N-carbamoylputrescine amidase